MARERFSDEGIKTLAQVYIYLLCGAEKSFAGKKLIAAALNGHKEKNESDIPAFHNPKAAFKRNYTLAGFDDLLKEHRGLMGISHTKKFLNIDLPNVGGLISIKDIVTPFDTELKKIKTPGKQKFIFENLNFGNNFKALQVARVYNKLL